ncbi:MAG: NAD(P)H-hydrate epimerase [Rhizobiaceae bacterium]|nr:NAD(P)H-hydrate epimerase [Rhizobiaceae bacterium]
MYELLSPSQMAIADQLTIKNGIPGIELMENAGQAVVDTLNFHFPKAQKILVVCGIGNNGGDGFVAARLLASLGKDVQVLVLGDVGKICGDAALALTKLNKNSLVDQCSSFAAFDVIIDALFGAGLDREIKSNFLDVINQINECKIPVLSVDLPSGIDGKIGKVMGGAIRADHTVTFFRKKPGHLLCPGRVYCGEVHLKQIGIDKSVLSNSGLEGLENQPGIWQKTYPLPGINGHKYHRGHTLALSGPPTSTGAARLMAQAALRSGAGLVTLASPRSALDINAANLTSVMLQLADSPSEVKNLLADKRFNCVALGPGLPPDSNTVEMVSSVLEMNRITILDAGALTAFSEHPDPLFEAITSSYCNVFLTPHDREFARLFPQQMKLQSKIDRARYAAEVSGATIVLKGPDTVVATPLGQVSVSNHAPPWLATAGSGDVLAGVIAGLASQGMPAFEAASAAVWLHGDAANRLGPAMISSDLDEGLKRSINHLLQPQNYKD